MQQDIWTYAIKNNKTERIIMHEYYFKIKKGDLEFEFSTTDKFTFEEKLSDWINGIVRGEYVSHPEPESEEKAEGSENPQRSGFIDVKNLSSINEITAPKFGNEILPDVPVDMDFEQALEESIQNPKTEVVEKVEVLSDFEGYMNSYNPQSPIDILIVTAMYVMNIENQERFTIKQLNAKLVPLTGKPVDHGMIEEAIAQNLVKIVPDLTGTSEFTEYTLTGEGEGYFVE